MPKRAGMLRCPAPAAPTRSDLGQPTTRPAVSSAAASTSACSVSRWRLVRRRSASSAPISSSDHAWPWAGPDKGTSARGRPRTSFPAHRAAPRAPPASPAAGCTKTRRKGPSRQSRALATLFSATPPARQRSSSPVSRCNRRARPNSASSVTSCTLAAMSAKRRPSSVDGSKGLPGKRGGPKAATKAGPKDSDALGGTGPRPCRPRRCRRPGAAGSAAPARRSGLP